MLAFLKSEGACFLADLEAGTDLPSPELSSALVELVLAGLVTNDSLQALRQVLAWAGDSGGPERRPLSSLEAELTAWQQARDGPPSPLPPDGRGCQAPLSCPQGGNDWSTAHSV